MTAEPSFEPTDDDDDLAVARDKIENLEIALLTSRRIGMAIGILMHSRMVTEEEAFDLLRQASVRTSRKVRDIADEVVHTGALN